MQIPGTNPRSTQSETLGVGPATCVLPSPPLGSDVCSSLGSTALFSKLFNYPLSTHNKHIRILKCKLPESKDSVLFISVSSILSNVPHTERTVNELCRPINEPENKW